MMKLIDGRILADKIKDEIVKETFALAQTGQAQRPNLAIILVGDREDSKIYVSLKEREGKKVGVDTNTYKFPANCSQEEILQTIDFLNQDEMIDGIIVQVPLPEHLDTDAIISRIAPDKDVDGFYGPLLSPVLLGVLESLKSEKISLDQPALLFGNSEAFVKVFQSYFPQLQFTDNLESLKELGPQADILISAVGQPNVIKKEMIKEGACLVDIGISRVGDKVCGDFDALNIKEKAGYLTPVPGGIGPLTVAFLLHNTLLAYKKKLTA